MSRLFWEGLFSQVLVGFWGGSQHWARERRNGSWCFEKKAEEVVPGNWVNSQGQNAAGLRISSEVENQCLQLWGNPSWWEPTWGWWEQQRSSSRQSRMTTGTVTVGWASESRLWFSGHKNSRILVQSMGKEMTPTTNVELSADLGMGGAKSQIWWDLWGTFFDTQVSCSNSYRLLQWSHRVPPALVP